MNILSCIRCFFQTLYACRRFGLSVLALSIISFLFSCNYRNQQIQERPSVTSIKFEGNGSAWSSTSNYRLQSAMQQKKNGLLTFLAPRKRSVPLDMEVLRLDAWRIETWYAHQGYFDAKFLGWEVRPVRKFFFGLFPLKPRVRIVGQVDEGNPTMIRRVYWKGVDSLVKNMRVKLKENISIVEDVPFALDAVKGSEGTIATLLMEKSYAYASASSKIQLWPKDCNILGDDVIECYAAQVRANCLGKGKIKVCRKGQKAFLNCDPDDVNCIDEQKSKYAKWLSKPDKGNVVDVTFEVNTGPTCVFGEILVHGEFNVPIESILEQIPIQPGDAYRVSGLGATQRSIFGTGLFSVASVAPEMGEEVGRVLPVHIALSESKHRQMRVGGGIEFESGKQGVHGSVDFRHGNLFNRMILLGWNNQIGYTFVPSYEEEEDDSSEGGVEEIAEEAGEFIEEAYAYSGITALSNLTFTIPRIMGPRWSLGLELEFERGVEPMYNFNSPTISPSLIWQKRRPKKYFRSVDVVGGDLLIAKWQDRLKYQ